MRSTSTRGARLHPGGILAHRLLSARSTHLRNLSEPCCRCCGNLTQFEGWVATAKAAAPTLDGIFMDNMDTSPTGYAAMYAPAAAVVRGAGLGVWASEQQHAPLLHPTVDLITTSAATIPLLLL